MASKLAEDEIKKHLSSLDGWTIENSCLVKEFKFKDFAAAIKFLNALAPVAEKLNHHPDWSNSYNKVLIRLTTHSESGLTQKDFDFAKAADQVAGI